MLDALESLGFWLARGLDPAEVAARHVTMVGDPLWRVDLLTIAWAIRYRDVVPRATVFRVDGVEIPTASIEDLIASKRTGRPKDDLDIAALEEIRRLRGERPGG